MKESTKLKNKLEMPLILILKRNYKKGFQNYLEESVSLRLEVLLKLKLEKSKTEFKMLFVLLRQLLNRESL